MMVGDLWKAYPGPIFHTWEEVPNYIQYMKQHPQ